MPKLLSVSSEILLCSGFIPWNSLLFCETVAKLWNVSLIYAVIAVVLFSGLADVRPFAVWNKLSYVVWV
jgi:hypothetical protein